MRRVSDTSDNDASGDENTLKDKADEQGEKAENSSRRPGSIIKREGRNGGHAKLKKQVSWSDTGLSFTAGPEKGAISAENPSLHFDNLEIDENSQLRKFSGSVINELPESPDYTNIQSVDFLPAGNSDEGYAATNSVKDDLNTSFKLDLPGVAGDKKFGRSRFSRKSMTVDIADPGAHRKPRLRRQSELGNEAPQVIQSSPPSTSVDPLESCRIESPPSVSLPGKPIVCKALVPVSGFLESLGAPLLPPPQT